MNGIDEIKPNPLLEELMEEAKSVGGKKGRMISCERFVVAVIEKVCFNASSIVDSEILNLRELLMTLIPDPKKARERLLLHIEEGQLYAVMDDMDFKRLLRKTQQFALSMNVSHVTASVLLVYIMDEASAVLKECIKDMPSSKEKKKEEPMVSISEKAQLSSLVSEIKGIRGKLQAVVFGQDHAINTVVTGYFQARLLSMVSCGVQRPLATFLFAGSPGVGKTFLAETTAKTLKLPFRRFDMSEYADKEANLEFCGSDKVYKDAKAGNVTGFVAEHPKCVLLFDEIEKAHSCVINLFLQILDAGRLRDNYTDQEVSFSDAIIIFTTNAGQTLYEEHETGELSSISRKVIINTLQKEINPQTGAPYFPAAICSRFASGNVVLFNQMSARDLRVIAKGEMERHAENLERELGINLFIEEGIYSALLFSEGASADARAIRGRAEAFFNNELYELLRLLGSEKAKTSISHLEKIRITLDLADAEDSVRQLFYSEKKPQVLLFAAKDTVAVCRKKAKDFDFYAVESLEAAIEILKNHDIDFALLEMQCGRRLEALVNLNIEDVDSPARDLFRFLREKKRDLPVYIVEKRSRDLSDEEQISFMAQGVRGILCLAEKPKEFAAHMKEIAVALHQQDGMIRLAKENKLLSFETAQTVSQDGKDAKITLFDFKLNVAVDAEDAKNILSLVSRPNVRFDEVLGAEDAKKELSYFVEYLKNPRKYIGTGVKAPKGVLLYGPPGTGKTMLAKAMAHESEVTFIAAEGNQFLKRYVGEGSEKVHELFKIARKYAPSILFIDEIDAIAIERRGGENSSGAEATLTALLAEMDGFVSDPSRPVFVLAATNFEVEAGRNKSLDSALLRRFDRKIRIDLPDQAARIRFLQMKKQANAALTISDLKLKEIALRAAGMSLADLDSAVELALRSAIREGSTVVTDAILDEAFETFNNGEEKRWDLSQLERIARHEAGHALLCLLSGETPSYLTIVSRGTHGGYLQHAEREEKAVYTKEELLARIRTALGGRAAEIVYYGERDGVSTGAAGDLFNATKIAKQVVGALGMDEHFGLAVVEDAEFSCSSELRAAANHILKEQMEQAVCLIQENREKLDALVKELMIRNHLSGEEIRRIVFKK